MLILELSLRAFLPWLRSDQSGVARGELKIKKEKLKIGCGTAEARRRGGANEELKIGAAFRWGNPNEASG